MFSKRFWKHFILSITNFKNTNIWCHSFVQVNIELKHTFLIFSKEVHTVHLHCFFWSVQLCNGYRLPPKLKLGYYHIYCLRKKSNCHDLMNFHICFSCQLHCKLPDSITGPYWMGVTVYKTRYKTATSSVYNLIEFRIVITTQSGCYFWNVSTPLKK